MNHSRTVACTLVSALLSLAVLDLVPTAAVAAEDSAYGRTPPRLSFYDGEVSFWRPGADDWAPARINLPLAPGDALYTGAGANLELQIGTLSFVRAGELTQLSLSNQEPGFIQLSFGGGHLAVDIRSQPRGHVIEVDTPGAAVVIDRAGCYRFRVTEERTSIIARRGGRATVTPAEGEPRVVMGGERVTIDARERFAIDEAPDPDVWDDWNYDRTDEVADAATGRYVPPGVYGTESLEDHGSWRNVPTYGWVWTPRVGPDWVPYSTGSWIWDSYYGWTWVDDAPWGWAPAHYGRWVYVNRYWAWAPGPVVVTPFYAPAVVAFFGGGVGVSVGFGYPALSWVALGWGEPLYPWWGPIGFIGRPCWYGWGGPRWHGHHGHHRDHHHHGHKGRDHDGHHGPHDYQNAKVHNAILTADKKHFGHGPVAGTRVPPNQVANLAPVAGKLPVKPAPASFAPQQGATVRPPNNAMAKPVVATRAAHDPSAALQAAGVAAPASAPRRPARVVSAPPQSAARSAPAGTADSINRSPLSAPRAVDAPQSAPNRAPASGRSSGASVGGGRPRVESDAPASGPRSAPAARVPDAPPMSAPRQQERERRGSYSTMPPPASGSREPRSAPRNVERVQPPAPPVSAPQQGRSERSAPAASQPHSSVAPPPQSAPRDVEPSGDYDAPASAPRGGASADRPSRAPSSGGVGYSAPSSGSVNRGASSSGGSNVGRPSSAPRGGAYGGSSGGGYSGRSGGGYGGRSGGGASSAPRSSSGSGSVGGGSRGGSGGGVGSGPRH